MGHYISDDECVEFAKYEVQLQACAQRLEAVLDTGKVKALGLMEVATAMGIPVSHHPIPARGGHFHLKQRAAARP